MFLHIAEEGHKLTIRSFYGDHHDEVKPACKDGESGHWYCDVHAEHFDNKLAVHMHHGHWTKSKCLLVWLCNDHGAETINAETRKKMNKEKHQLIVDELWWEEDDLHINTKDGRTLVFKDCEFSHMEWPDSHKGIPSGFITVHYD